MTRSQGAERVSQPHRREFDLALELVTPDVPASVYRVVPGGIYAEDETGQYRYDAYLPTAAPTPGRPPVAVFVHGDGPAEFLREPRGWASTARGAQWLAPTAWPPPPPTIGPPRGGRRSSRFSIRSD